MGDVSSEENQVKILLEEYKTFREEIFTKSSAFHKDIYTFSSVVLILFGLCFKENFDIIFVMLPFLIITFYVLIIQDLRGVFMLGMYNQVIEEKINLLLDLDYKIIYWEHLAEHLMHKGSLRFSLIICIPIIIIYSYSSYRGVWVMETFDTFYYYVFMIIYFSLFLYAVYLSFYVRNFNENILWSVKHEMNL